MPLSNMDQLKTMEDYISQSPDNKLKLVAVLKHVGGTKIENVVRGMMKKLLILDVAAKFSLHGRRGKEGFISLQLYKAVLYAVRDHQQFNLATDNEINKIVSDWLKYTPDRAKSGRRSHQKLDQLVLFVCQKLIYCMLWTVHIMKSAAWWQE